MNNSSPDYEPLLQVESLHKTFYDSGKAIHVLRGASLNMQAGRHVSISGQSGCGKSTFLNLICGLEDFDHGEVRWNGRPVESFSSREITRQRGHFFGFIFQSYYLMAELNTLENVLVAARLVGKVRTETRERACHLLEMVGLKDRMKYDVQKLSGGERQRVAIARALMNQPQVLLADEPTGNLDESTAEEVMHLIFEVCEKNNSSLLLVTHNPGFARMTHSHCVLHDGVIIEASAIPSA